MAVGNALVTTAKFKPLSYSEWAAPLKELNTQHAAEEAALESLSEDASKYERYIRANPDSEVARQYRDFLGQIEAEADALSRYGISPDRRTSLANLRRSYNQNIKPVRAAVETLDDIEKQYTKDYQKGIIGAPEIDINYLLEHPEYTVTDYKNSYKLGKDIYDESKNLFKNLTGFNATPKQYTEGNSIITEFPQGYSSEEIQTLFTDENNPNLTQELKDTWKLIKNKYSFDTLAPDQQELFAYYALQGALSGVKPPRYTSKNAPKSTSTKTDNSGQTSANQGGRPQR